jgi:ribonuclease E
MASTEDLFPTTENAERHDPARDPASDAASDAAPTDSSAAAGDGSGEAPAPARKRARRATKKASAPAPAPAPEQSSEEPQGQQPSAAKDATAEGSAEEGTPAPAAKKATAKRAAKKAPAKRASKKAAVPAEPVDAAAGDEPVQEPEAAQDDETPHDDEMSQPAATVPSFGVLFQAPDVASAPARRTRKTAKKAAAPSAEPVPEALQPDATVDAEAAPATQGPADETDSEGGDGGEGGRRRRRRGGKGRGRGRADDSSETAESAGASEASDAGDTRKDRDEAGAETASDSADHDETEGDGSSSRRRRRRRRGGAGESEDPPGTVTRVREARRDEPQSVKGSTRLEAKKQRRREGREAGRRRTVITEAEFLARRESVERVMAVRERDGKTQIGVLEDGVLVEHYVSRESNASMAGNVYLGRVQNVLPSMEAAFVDIGKGRNAVLYAGEVNWDAAGLENNQPKRIENALKSGDAVLVQVTKDPIGHKGARLTSQISLPGRYLVYVPEGSMTGISRKLPDTERARLKGILKEVVPDSAGVIVRTAAEGASEDELRADVERLTKTWEKIKQKAESKGKAKGGGPVLVHGEPDLTVRVIRDVFNEDFTQLVVAGDQAYAEVSEYLSDVAPDLAERLHRWTSEQDLFTHYRVDEQIAKAMDRKVWLPSGGSLVIDRTEAMTVVDVNTGKFVGSGGNLEETVTKNNIEAAEEIVRQLRLRDIGGIIVIDFIDMVLESNRELVVRRLLECLGRDRTKHQVAEVTSLGLVQMTRKRVGSGLIEVFSETCEHCGGRGIIVHADPVEKSSNDGSGHGGGHGGSGAQGGGQARTGRTRRGRSGAASQPAEQASAPVHSGPTPAQIAAAAHAAALKSAAEHPESLDGLDHDGLDHDGHDHDGLDDHELEQVDLTQVTDTSTERTRTEQAPARHVQAEQVQTEPAAAQPTAAAAATATAPKRRKRGRVVAPAGPPRPSTDGAPASS